MKLQQTETGKHIVKIDATALAKSTCLKKLWHSCIDGYTTPLKSVNIEFGQAFHIFAKELELSKGEILTAVGKAQDYYRGRPMFTSPRKSYLNVEYLTEVCTKYAMEVYPGDIFTTLKHNNRPFVEENFAIPILITDTAEYFLCGTIDRVGFVGREGPLSFLDYKTTGKSKAGAREYFYKYEMLPQMLCYAWALRKIVKEYPEHPFASYMGPNDIPSAYIQGVFISSGSKIEFDRSPRIEITDSKLDEWFSYLICLIDDIDIFLKYRATPNREGLLNGSCAEGWDLCAFFGACNAPDEVAEKRILEQNFMTVEYDPLNFSKKDEMLNKMIAQTQYETK
jgi:hypothetical protein